MLISCECLNFNANLPQLQRFASGVGGNGNNNNSSNAAGAGEASLPALLLQMFVQKYPKNFVYYSNFVDFFKNAHGPIPDLTVNAINQRDLIYSLTLDVPPPHHNQSWQLYICINCKLVLCAKRLIAGAGATSPTHYLFNSQLICSDEDLKARRSHKSYSESYGLLIMDNDDTGTATLSSSVVISPAQNSTAGLSIGSLMTTNNQGPLDGRVQRLRQLQAFQQSRVQAEINETNESIERYTEKKFALLKSFREKCEQEGALLTRLIQQVPELTIELLDRAMPVALEVTTAPRRRNTISSRRDLTIMPTTPTTPLIQPPSFMEQLPPVAPPNAAISSIITSRKMSNFDTPPATPEATPMSVGNSPTFRQQQQQQQQQQTVANSTLLLSMPAAAGATDEADDCLFDLEDVDDGPTKNAVHIYQQQHQQQNHQQQQYQRMQQQLQQQQPDNMSDADEAEDALDLDSSLPIPMRGGGAVGGRGQFYANFARSLPVEIANSPLAERAERANNNNNNNNNHHHHNHQHQQQHHHHHQQHHVVLEEEDVLDNTVDIAASIKALAKSVHGEPVFGDLPRPRLRSQI